jgi:hypothetical protein
MNTTTIWAIGFIILVTGSIGTIFLGMFLEYRLNVTRINAGVLAGSAELPVQRRLLGWGLGLLFGGVALFLGSLLYGLPGEANSEGQGLGLVMTAVGLAFITYNYLIARTQQNS